ncbi:mechanosensitive ion channel family protein [Variovorax humicola]|uniref:Small-conductance mechanosensitive channel n=1 Tax=Variovorax humicola TaxID=1769758 RepID=A0ABU8W7Z8_9BURK
MATAVAMLATSASGAVAANPDSPEQALEQAAVVMDGATLFVVRSPLGFPASERAAGIAKRIEAAARDRSIDPAFVRTGTVAGMTAIFAGPARIMVVSDADAQAAETTVEALAGAAEDRVRSAIIDYRVARSPERVRNATLLALTATVLFLVAAAVSVWLTIRLRRGIEHALHPRVQTLGFQSFAIVRAEHIRAVLSGILKFVGLLVLLALTFAWLVYVLDLFPWTIGVGNALLEHVVTPLTTLGRDFLAAIPNLIFLAILYFIFRSALRIVRLFFDAVEQGRVKLQNFEPEWAMPTYKIVRLAIIAFALVIAYPYVPGSSSAAFKGVSLFLGVVFSLGSSGAISNIIAGYMMTYRRAFRVGDRVKIGEVTGEITAVRLQVSHLRTMKNEEVVIPNSQIINSHVVNYTTLARKDGLLLHTSVQIGYNTPWRQVEAMLLEAAHRTEGLVAAPKPFVLQTKLGDFAIIYELNVGCDDPRRMHELYSALHRNILDVFNEYGVSIVTPAYEGDPETPKVVPREKWFSPPAKADNEDQAA